MEKELKGNGSVNGGSKVQKYSYEELNQICGELSAQNQRLLAQMQQMNDALQYRRIDYLLKIVELSNAPGAVAKFSSDFVQSCIDEIEEAVAIPEQETPDAENEAE